MDAKSLAKSKRAHSQHHSKKHHPNQASKVPSAGSVAATSAKKPLGKQIKEKSHHSQGSSALPSNWDRYEDDYDSGLENPSHDSMSQPTDVKVPKSKGADYADLISEAKSHSQTSSLESIPSFDDVFTDFNQGVGSLVSVKGQSILSWIGGDNFVVEEKATASQEVSFLSLDLHALAEQLANVDLSQWLFIEADLLPPDLRTEELQESRKQESGQDEATKAAREDSDEFVSRGLSDRVKHMNQYCEITSSDTSEGSKSKNQFKDELSQFGTTGQTTGLKSAAEFNVYYVANPKKSSRFEAAAAEKDLDVLLDSFSETKFLDYSGFTSCASLEETSASLLEGMSSDQSVPTLPVKKGADLSESALGANLDDTIDGLLKEASSLINQNDAPRIHEVKAAPLDVVSSPSSHPISKSKLLDDFDSWLDTI